MIKLGFALDVQDDWPPYEVEHLWVERRGDAYVVESIPFFLKGIALGDVISAQLDDDGYVNTWSMVEESGNSTIWIIRHRKSDILDKLELSGCIIEDDDMNNLYSANIPKNLDFEIVDSILDPYVRDGSASVAYPTIRHR